MTKGNLAIFWNLIENWLKKSSVPSLEATRVTPALGELSVEIAQPDGLFVEVTPVNLVRTAYVSSPPEGLTPVNLHALIKCLAYARSDLKYAYKDVEAKGLDSIDDLYPVSDQSNLTLAGQALRKHGGRQHSTFPKMPEPDAEASELARKILDDIVYFQKQNVAPTSEHVRDPHFIKSIDIRDQTGRGVRFGNNQKRCSILEPQFKG